MPPGYTFGINVILLAKFYRSSNFNELLTRYPGANLADATNQAVYYRNIHGIVTGRAGETPIQG